MLNSVVFRYFSRKSRFAEALSRLPTDSWPRTGPQQWNCYRLGLYSLIASTLWDGRHLRGGMAVAVSLAACGRKDEADAIARELTARKTFAPYRAEFSRLLAPFFPALALEQAEAGNALPDLKSALLLKLGRAEEAMILIDEALESPSHSIELQLLASNAQNGFSPRDKLERLNLLFQHYGLSPVVLTDPDLPPSVMNVAHPAIAEQVHGPLISILVTAYNAEDRIRFTLQSLLNQTYQDIEVLVIDDASSDATGEIVQAMAASDPRLRYVRSSQNIGTYAAKVLGMEYAVGEFVVCHDADDWSHPKRMELQVAPMLKNPRVVATVSQWLRVSDDGMFYSRSIYPLCRFNPSSPMFRREPVMRIAGLWDVGARTGADSEFIARLKLVFARHDVLRVQIPLALGAHRPNSLMTAPATGYGLDGVSMQRLAYWEHWTMWHIAELRAGRRPRMPSEGLSFLPTQKSNCD